MMYYAIDVDSVQGTEGEAVLMRKDGSSGEYRQVDGESAAIEYAGDWTGTWTVPNETETEPLTASLPFAEGHRGSIERLKVRFNYSNANGDDYIDSDEIVLCRGTYIGAGETFLGASGFSVSFPLDTDLVDPGKVKGVSATIMVDGTGVPLPEDSISISSDGTASVGCLMEYLAEQGVSLAYDGSSYPVWITLLYEDGDVSWEDSSTGSVDMPNRGEYITGGYVGPLSGSDITPAGFRATFFLDAEVIGHPTTAQPYEGGRTLDLSSVTLVRNYSGTEITVEDVEFSPAESPTLSFTYNAPSDEQLTPGDYRVEVELCYNDPNADPPVVNLLDSGSEEFTVEGEIFGSGDFSYSVASYLGGSIELVKGIDPGELENLRFTVYAGDSPTALFDPNAKIISGFSDGEGWVGFEFSKSKGDEIPSLDLGGDYSVEASAVFNGKTYTSDRFSIEMPAPSFSMVVTNVSSEYSDFTLAGSGEVVYTCSPLDGFSIEPHSALIELYNESNESEGSVYDYMIAWEEQVKDSGAGTITHPFSFSDVDLAEYEEAKYFKVHIYSGVTYPDGTVTEKDAASDFIPLSSSGADEPDFSPSVTITYSADADGLDAQGLITIDIEYDAGYDFYTDDDGAVVSDPEITWWINGTADTPEPIEDAYISITKVISTADRIQFEFTLNGLDIPFVNTGGDDIFASHFALQFTVHMYGKNVDDDVFDTYLYPSSDVTPIG